jgi:hypothetical protein
MMSVRCTSFREILVPRPIARTRRIKKSEPIKAREPAPSNRKMQIEGVARLAGVSVSTVSRALNQSSLVIQVTRARIADLARSANNTINAAASNLRLHRNKTAAVAVPYDARAHQHISDPFFDSILGRIAGALTEVMTCSSRGSTPNGSTRPRSSMPQGVLSA